MGRQRAREQRGLAPEAAAVERAAARVDEQRRRRRRAHAHGDSDGVGDGVGGRGVGRGAVGGGDSGVDGRGGRGKVEGRLDGLHRQRRQVERRVRKRRRRPVLEHEAGARRVHREQRRDAREQRRRQLRRERQLEENRRIAQRGDADLCVVKMRRDEPGDGGAAPAHVLARTDGAQCADCKARGLRRRAHARGRLERLLQRRSARERAVALQQPSQTADGLRGPGGRVRDQADAAAHARRTRQRREHAVISLDRTIAGATITAVYTRTDTADTADNAASCASAASPTTHANAAIHSNAAMHSNVADVARRLDGEDADTVADAGLRVYAAQREHAHTECAEIPACRKVDGTARRHCRDLHRRERARLPPFAPKVERHRIRVQSEDQHVSGSPAGARELDAAAADAAAVPAPAVAHLLPRKRAELQL
eukprot:1177816-Pleurochrysis_carterae.AAC.1